MARYSFKKAVNYPPWIGSSYGSKGNRRILLTGRSYYDAHYGDRTIQDYIQNLIKSGKEDLFFNSLETITSEARHWKQSFGKLKLDRKKYWSSVCYHQFLQGILPDSYTQPSRQMWKEGQEVFKSVLQSLEPEIVCIFSFEVFDAMPTMGGRRGEDYALLGDVMQTWETTVSGTSTTICRMMSPRKGIFRLNTWKQLYNSFLGDYKMEHQGVRF